MIEKMDTTRLVPVILTTPAALACVLYALLVVILN